MKNTKVVTVIAAVLLTVGLVSTSSAQDNNIDNAQGAIEVITIVGNRAAPSLASVCVNDVIAHSIATVDRHHLYGDTSVEAREVVRSNLRQAIKQCIAQSVDPTAAQI